jgi:hypothetical protein
MRMSAEYAFGMVRPPDESMPPDSPIYRSLGIPAILFGKNMLLVGSADPITGLAVGKLGPPP